MTTPKEVICHGARGYNLTKGKTYEVIELTPPHETPHFIFPSYVTVRDDNGKPATAHAWRFTTTDGEGMDDYINLRLTHTKEST